MKSKTIAYLTWCLCFIGFCGMHRVYLDRPGSGILQFLTLGGFGIWQLIDLFMIPSMVNNFTPQVPINQAQSQTQNVVININKDVLKDNTNE